MKDEIQIIKIGGNIIDNPDNLSRFLNNFAKLSGKKILVHGGGKKATQMSEQLRVPVKRIGGRRVTDLETLDIATMIYGGLINKNIVASLIARECMAIGLSGADGNSILAVKRPPVPIDFGWVGDVTEVNLEFIQNLMRQNITPVFCAISHDGNGQLLNINADTVATRVAITMSKRYNVLLMYCFEKNGVLENIDDPDSLIPNIDAKKYDSLKKQNIIHHGMLPKLENCFDALNSGVSQVKIGNAKMIERIDNICTTITL